ncbi:enolase C-terminal domain-like protein [Actinoallomurus sp. CA-150999]|uniref:enolase C-terminal domain-like protein n=1 Tax=Actinoallomurus sp. CA-150999 TaxID=3239887 RepID=UPI003D89F731
MGAVLEIFKTTSEYDTKTVVHCWGSAVGMAANYHAALAGDGDLAEWPLPWYPIRTDLLIEPFQVENGELIAPTAPGLGA